MELYNREQNVSDIPFKLHTVILRDTWFAKLIILLLKFMESL